MKISMNQNTGEIGFKTGANVAPELLEAFKNKMTARASNPETCEDATKKEAEALEAKTKAT